MKIKQKISERTEGNTNYFDVSQFLNEFANELGCF
jgi:hypothetical protein